MEAVIDEAKTKAPEIWREVEEKYGRSPLDVRREEVLAHIMGHKGGEAIKATLKTLEGKAWYNRAWQAIKDAVRGMMSRMGFNRADLSEIDRMSPDETMDWLVKNMAEGRTLGKVERNGKGGSLRDAVKNFFGLVDTSKGYTVADLEKDRPYLKKNNQAANSTFVDPAQNGGNHFGPKPVVAALKSLDGLNISNRAPEVNRVFDNVRDLTENENESRDLRVVNDEA